MSKHSKLIGSKKLLALIIVVFFCLSMFVGLIQMPEVHATTFFSDTFASGSFSAWDGGVGQGSGTASIVTSPVFDSNAYAAEFNNPAWDQTFCAKNIGSGYNTVDTRFYIDFATVASTITSGNYVKAFFQLEDYDDVNTICTLGLENTGSGVVLVLTYNYPTGGATATYAFAYTTNNWYCFEVQFVDSSTVGLYTVWINGAQVISETGLNTSGTESGGEFVYGIPLYSSINFVDYLNDVVIANSYVGPIATGPTFSSITTSTTTEGQSCSFGVTWGDTLGLATTGGYIFGTNNTGHWVNATWTGFLSNPQTVTTTQTLNSTVGYVIQYEWWANDTSGLWSNTGLQTLTTTVLAPVFSSLTVSTTIVAQSCSFGVTVTDAVGLATTGGFIFGCNATGSWINSTWATFTSNPQILSVAKTLPSTVGYVVQYEWWANDTNNLWNNTGIQSLTVTNLAPSLSSLTVSTTLVGYSCAFGVTCSDTVGLASTGGYIFGSNVTRAFTNSTWTPFGSNPQTLSVVQTLSFLVGDTDQYEWWVNDTSGIWANTGIQSLTTTAVPDTFGYTAILPSSSNLPDNCTMALGAFSVSNGGNTWVKSISIYTSCNAGGSNVVASKACIYNDTGSDDPYIDMTGVSPQIYITSTLQWWTYTFSVPVHIPDGNYWIAEAANASLNIQFYINVGVTRVYHDTNYVYANEPASPFNSIDSTGSPREFSFYATYQTSAPSGSVTANPNYAYTIATNATSNYLLNSAGTILSSNTNPVTIFGTATSDANGHGANALYVAAGTYTFSSTFDMSNLANENITFSPSSLITITNGLDTDAIAMVTDSNCALIGIQINGNAAEQTTSSVNGIINMWDCSNCIINDANITNCRLYGVGMGDDKTGDAPDGVINSLITFCGWNGITLGEGGTYTVGDYAINNTIAYCSDVGITCWASDGCYIIDNYIHDMNGTTGAESPGLSAHYGIAVEADGGGETIENNTIANCAGTTGSQGIGICVGTGGTEDSYSLVEYNNITSCNDGITGYLAVGDVITNNLITNWATGYSFGIYPDDDTNDIIASNILISTSTSTSLGYGIYSESSNNCTFCNNTITIPLAADDYGVVIGSNYNLISGNNIQSATGIYIASGTDNRVYQNILSNCTTGSTNSGTGTITAFANPAILAFNCPSYYGTVSPATGSYSESTSSQVTITLTPDVGYIAVLNVDGVNVTLTNNQYVLSMASDHNVYAIFIQPTIYYTITVSSAIGNPTPSGSVLQGGSYVTSVTSPVSGGTGTQYLCIGYEIDGGSLIAGTSYTFTNVQANHTIQYLWEIEYYVTVVSSYGITSGSGWYAAFSMAYAGLNTGTVSGGTGIQYLFVSWTESGGGNLGTNYTQSEGAQITLGPVTITANWQTQYYLTISSSYGSPIGQGWYNASATASFSITTPYSGGIGVQYVFSSWAYSGSGGYAGSASSYTVTMNNPIIESASWITQYQITPSSDAHSTILPSTVSWYNAGSSQTFNYSASASYSITGVYVNSVPVAISTSYTFSNIQSPETIQVFSSAAIPPTSSSIIVSTTIAGSSCTLSVTVNDAVSLTPTGQYIFGTNNTGTWVWSLAQQFTSTPQTISFTITLNSIVGTVVACQFNFTDNNGLSGTTGLQILITGVSPTPTPTSSPTSTPTPTSTPIPIITPTTSETLYFLSTTYTTLSVSGFALDTSYLNTFQSVSESYSGTGIVNFGFQIYIYSSATRTMELTDGSPEAIITVNGNYTGIATAIFDMPQTTVILGWEALQIDLEEQYNSGAWITIATFVTPVLVTTEIASATWTFNLYINNTQTTTNTYPTVAWGNHNYPSDITDVSFTVPQTSAIGLWDLQRGDIIGLILLEYLAPLGTAFYAIILLGISAVLWFRYKNTGVILYFFATLVSGGLMFALLPIWAAPVAAALILLMITFIFYRILR